MNNMENNQELLAYCDEIAQAEPIRITFSRLSDKTYKYKTTKVVQKKLDGKTVYSVERYTEKQVFHTIVWSDELVENILEELNYYNQIDAESSYFNFNLRITKKKKILFSKKKKSSNTVGCLNDEQITSHNRKKKYILEEGMYIPAFIDLGIFTKEGKIVNSKYDKFKQINRFVEIIDDGISKLEQSGYLKDRKVLKILDFGCGKSYLTFVLYYYLTVVKSLDVEIIGLDLKEDVINSCNEIAKKYGYKNLAFEIGDISNYKYNNSIDIVITLHACDTATDYALFNAINWNAKMIFSVPCCQHEVNSSIRTDDLEILTKFGLIKERVASLMTDSIRASLLEYMGYKTQVLEFVDISHSPKNILIRAYKTNISKEKREKSLEEITKLKKIFNFEQTLYNLLKSDGRF